MEGLIAGSMRSSESACRSVKQLLCTDLEPAVANAIGRCRPEPTTLRGLCDLTPRAGVITVGRRGKLLFELGLSATTPIALVALGVEIEHRSAVHLVVLVRVGPFGSSRSTHS
jgi:hypothetical protein